MFHKASETMRDQEARVERIIEAREVINTHLAKGMTLRALARNWGLDPTTLRYIVDGTAVRITDRVHRNIMSRKEG